MAEQRWSELTSMTPRAYQHVIFDLDGTLADTAADIVNAANHVRRTGNLEPLPVDTVLAYVGAGARQLVARVVPQRTPADLDEALRVFLRHYETHLLDETRLYPGIQETLDALSEEAVTASVLSNKPAALCRRLLDGLGVGAYFCAILGGDSLPVRKPDPAGVYHLEQTLENPRAAMLLIGDSPIDRDTAHAAGVAFCGVDWGFGSQALRSAGHADLAATPAVILSRLGMGRPAAMSS
jgi:phosphoglycolate phosphatase